MNGLRAAEAPAVEPEPAQRANPLVQLLADTADAELIIDALQRLPCDAQSAHWVEELLEDERLGGLSGVREEAVNVLLNFGHPHALLISPEDLIRFRRVRPTDDIKRGWIAGASAPGSALLLLMLALGANPLRQWPIVNTLSVTLAVCGAWALSVGVRALLPRCISRSRLIREVSIALVASVPAYELVDPLSGIMLLVATVPIALTGLAGGWLDER